MNPQSNPFKTNTVYKRQESQRTGARTDTEMSVHVSTLKYTGFDKQFFFSIKL